LTRQKVNEVFVRIQKERGLIVRELGRLSDTRWACRYMNIAVIDERYDVIIAVLTKVSKLRGVNDTEIRTIAVGILSDVRSYQLVANLIILKKILSLSHGVNETLQSSTLNVVQCGKAIAGLMTSISDLRHKESSWDEMWRAIQTQCESQGIELTQLTDNKRKRKIREIPDMLYSCTTEHRNNASADVYKSIQVNLFLPVVNRIESELKHRFSTDALNILASLACVPCPSSEQFLVYEAI